MLKIKQKHFRILLIGIFLTCFIGLLGTATVSATPQAIGSYTPSPTSLYRDILVDGNYAYCAAESDGLHVIDVSDKSSPTAATTVALSSVSTETALAAEGNTLFMSLRSGGIAAIDISDPTNAKLISVVDSPSECWGIDVVGNYLYVAEWSQGVRIWDMSNPSAMSAISSISMPAGGYPLDIIVDGNYAFVAAGADGFVILDVSDKSNPIIAGSLNLDYTTWSVDLNPSNNLAYVGTARGYVHVIDYSTKTNPVEKGSIKLTSDVYDLYYADNIVFAADYTKGFAVVDVSNPESPTTVGDIDLGARGYGVDLQGDYVYLALGFDGMQIYEKSSVVPVGAGGGGGTCLGTMLIAIFSVATFASYSIQYLRNKA